MKKVKRLGLDREENYLVKAKVTVKDDEIYDVPCKIFLPERVQEKPYVILKPSKKDASRIFSSHEGALRATIYGFNKEKELSIEAPQVYFLENTTKHWGNGVSDNTIIGEPQDLHVVHHLRSNEDGQRTNIVLWVSPNKLLTPFISSTSSYTGDLKYERINNIEFLINNEIRFIFDKHFRSKYTENGDFVQWSFLAACTELNTPADDTITLKEKILPNVDDFLLIASFAARQRTVCLGWTASDSKSLAKFYRGNFVFPDASGENTLNDELIDSNNFNDFIQKCYPNFLEFENKLSIRNALHSILPFQSGTLETAFLRMFAGLESLILDFRRKENVEFIVPKENWSLLKDHLQKCLKNSTKPMLEIKQRASIYTKLNELNRVSLREAFDLFCNKHHINLTDLWPVFGANKLAGLSDIRNKLIHGDPFPRDLFESLIVANDNLEYILERVLLRILNWDISETKVSPDYLKEYVLAIKNMPIAQAKLSEYINGFTYSTTRSNEK